MSLVTTLEPTRTGSPTAKSENWSPDQDLTEGDYWQFTSPYEVKSDQQESIGETAGFGLVTEALERMSVSLNRQLAEQMSSVLVLNSRLSDTLSELADSFAASFQSALLPLQTFDFPEVELLGVRAALASVAESIADLGANPLPLSLDRRTEPDRPLLGVTPPLSVLDTYMGQWVAVSHGRVVAFGSERAPTKDEGTRVAGEAPSMLYLSGDPDRISGA